MFVALLHVKLWNLSLQLTSHKHWYNPSSFEFEFFPQRLLITFGISLEFFSWSYSFRINFIGTYQYFHFNSICSVVYLVLFTKRLEFDWLTTKSILLCLNFDVKRQNSVRRCMCMYDDSRKNRLDAVCVCATNAILTRCGSVRSVHSRYVWVDKQRTNTYAYYE